jgi:Ser/Thr protein kinase RdoA (MazF antagonist)
VSGPTAGRSAFDLLSPELATEAIEEAYGLELEGCLEVYPSYVNRVYGMKDSEGRGFVAKFYRPGRWREEAILDEHAFLADCAAEEIPVVAPVGNTEAESLSSLVLETAEGEEVEMRFALFPKMGGRNFEPETDEDWIRLGGLAGRLHAVGRKKPAPNRLCLGAELGYSYAAELEGSGLVHPECRGELFEVLQKGLKLMTKRFEGQSSQRIHGDLHRGNLLDRPGSGLVLVDFDDMLMGPPIQDLWLLLPGRRKDSGRELSLLLEGYEEFSFLDPESFGLIEPLRFLRMLYFILWRARQRGDYWFRREFPDWGSRAFWITELDDFRDQLEVMETEGASE